jgi:hypothetical protein
MAAEHDSEQKAKRHYSAACTKHKTAIFSLWHGQSHVHASLKHLDDLLSPCKVHRAEEPCITARHSICLRVPLPLHQQLLHPAPCHTGQAFSTPCAVILTTFLLQGLFDKPAHQRAQDELLSGLKLLQGLQQFEGLCRDTQLFIAKHAQLLVLQEGVEISG